jgi:enoyl-CoA hydratase/carnithine racemase
MNLPELDGLESLNVTIENTVAHIQLCRPEALNSMNPAFWQELPVVVKAIDQAAAARVIVISSTGKHFCAGMDLAVFGNGGLGTDSELGRKHESMRRKVLQLQEIFTDLEKIRQPVLAAIQGGCIGGAVDMVSACDSRYCTEEAFFQVAETNIGMTADLGTLQRLPKLMPEGLARELVYTGRRLTAEEAKACGLVNEVYKSHEAMIEGVLAVAAQIAQHSPLAISGCKEMMNYARDHAVADSLNYMAAWQSGMFQPQHDMMEAFTAKAEKRDPVFEELNIVKSPIE